MSPIKVLLKVSDDGNSVELYCKIMDNLQGLSMDYTSVNEVFFYLGFVETENAGNGDCWLLSLGIEENRINEKRDIIVAELRSSWESPFTTVGREVRELLAWSKDGKATEEELYTSFNEYLLAISTPSTPATNFHMALVCTLHCWDLITFNRSGIATYYKHDPDRVFNRATMFQVRSSSILPIVYP